MQGKEDRAVQATRCRRGLRNKLPALRGAPFVRQFAEREAFAEGARYQRAQGQPARYGQHLPRSLSSERR